VQSTGVACDLGDPALRTLLARNGDPAIVGDEDGLLITVKKDAVIHFWSPFRRTPNAVAPHQRARAEFEMRGERVGRSDLSLQFIDSA